MTFNRISKKIILAALFAGMFASACQPTPTATLTPRPTATKLAQLPTPTAVVVSQVEGQVVGTVAPTPPPAPVAVNATPAPPVIQLTILPTYTPAPGTQTVTAARPAITTFTSTATATNTPAPNATKTSAPTITNTPPPDATKTPTPANTNTPADTPTPQDTATATSAPTASPGGASIFGVELGTLNAAGGLPQAKTLGAKWLRRNGLIWSDVEPSEGARNWGAAAGLEQELRDASAQGFEVILIVRSAPAWAQLSGKMCGPIKPDKNAAFAAFLHDAVARYSAAPYNVKYWEIWNEPDADPAGFAGDEPFGCMGDATDDFYGGGTYGNLLKAVYPKIKSANQAALVMFGGLLLDCDPANPPPNKGACLPAKFLEGALRAGAGPYFDGVSFHAYDYFSYAEGKFGNSNWGASWNTTGPVTIVKARFIRDVLNRYAAGDKFLINTEGALILFNGKITSDPLEYTKADYAIKMFTACMAERLRACVWYNMRGWFVSGLVDNALNPGYAFRAIQFIIPRLQNTAFVAERAGTAGVKAYEFNAQGKRVLIAWSADGATRSLTLEAPPAAVYDLFGASQGRPQTVNLTEAPFIIELN